MLLKSISRPVWEQLAIDQFGLWQVVPRQVFTAYSCLLILNSFAVVSQVSCLGVSSVFLSLPWREGVHLELKQMKFSNNEDCDFSSITALIKFLHWRDNAENFSLPLSPNAAAITMLFNVIALSSAVGLRKSQP